MSEYLFNNPEDRKFDDNEVELEKFYNNVNDFFGENVFLLDENNQKSLIKQKVTSMFKSNGVRIDLLRLSQLIDTKVDLLEKDLKETPENLDMQKTISELKEQQELTKKLFHMCEHA